MMKLCSKCLVLFLGILFLEGVKALDHGATCIPANDQCDLDNGLKCDSTTNRCDCIRKEDMVYDESEKSCLVKASKLCLGVPGEPEFGCVQNAVCEAPVGDWDCAEEPPPANCTRTCNCDYETVISSDLRCLKKERESCSITDPCDQENGLICGAAGICTCSDPIEQYSEYTSQLSREVCYTRVQGECDPPNYKICGQNAECSPTGRCNCKVGHVPDLMFEKCFRGYNQTCTLSDDSTSTPDPNGERSCNLDSGLECVNGRCACILAPSQQYDEQKDICASIEGKPCTFMTQNSLPYYHCKTGLTCTQIAANNLYNGICRLTKNEDAKGKASKGAGVKSATLMTIPLAFLLLVTIFRQ